MTAAEALLADLHSRGVEMETDGNRIRWRPAFMVSPREAEQLRIHKADVIGLLRDPDALPRCPACRRPLDSALRCPKCFDRLCVDCGRLTGTYLVMRCVACGVKALD